MRYGVATNTHTKYQTCGHTHLDSFVGWMLGGREFPDSGLSLVECADGRWFVEVDYGVLFDGMPGISCPDVVPYVEPEFHVSESSAMTFALECIKKVYPVLANRDLHKSAADYFGDE